jgi:N-acetylmuramoyl-L-alanine amidase
MTEVIHERIFASNKTLRTVPTKLVGGVEKQDYGILASDVRFVKLDHSKTRIRHVWEPGAKVSDLVKKYNADFGINAPFFDPPSATPIADCIADGQIINYGYGKTVVWQGLTVTKDGVADIGRFDINGVWDIMIKTSPPLITDGQMDFVKYIAIDKTAPDIADANGNVTRQPRTFFGFDKAGDYLIAVADGRTRWDQGLTVEEMALYMQSKGAYKAHNFDGGSSSVLADQTGILNYQPYGEAIVNHAVLFFIDKTPLKDWRQIGFDHLVDNYNLDPAQHTPTDTVDLGMLGTLLKRRDEK